MNRQRGDNKILAGYFFPQRGRVITNPWHNKFYLMWDALTKHRTEAFWQPWRHPQSLWGDEKNFQQIQQVAAPTISGLALTAYGSDIF